MVQEIFIIDDDVNSANKINKLFTKESFKIKSVKTEKIDVALRNIPSLIIIDEDNIRNRHS